jgi:D-alanyl-D-alanine carboxypeptidase
VIGFAAAIMAGLLGAGSAFRGAKTVTHSARERQSHVQQADQRLTEILDQVGQRAAVLLVLCKDEETGQTVAARAAERGTQSWHVPRAEFLAALDRLGDNYDWVRPAAAESATRPPRGE